MKKIIYLLAILFTVTAFAQVPNKMSYQTVVRDGNSNLVTNSEISVQISILKNGENGPAVFTEVHRTATNKNGLASFVIGEGTLEKGSFEEIDWSSGSYYIKTATDIRGGSNYEIVGVSQILSVPYALNALHSEDTFSGNYEDLEGKPINISEFVNDVGYITGNENGNSKKRLKSGVPSQNWSLFGNSKSDATKDKLGTTDFTDLVLVTNNLDRLRITAAGDINIARSLDIGEDLRVNRNVDLNILGGATTNNGDFTVENGSATQLTGTLTVDGATNLNSSLDVNNAAATNLTGTLNVDGKTTLQNTLDVENQAATNLTGTLNVAGETSLQNTLDVNNQAATNLTGTLNVDGKTSLQNTLDVNNQAATNLTGTLNVGGKTTLQNTLDVENQAATNLTGILNVDGKTTLQNTLEVQNEAATILTGDLTVEKATILNNTLNANGQVTINTSLSGGDGSYGAYPLRVQGSSQGIAVKLNAGTPKSDNNFITFFNSSGGAVGRIEGQTSGEVASDPQFIYDQSILVAEEVKAGVNVGLSFIPTAVGGVVVSAGPCLACIGMAAADLILASANLVSFNVFAFENLGVTYQSGSADYAEWLKRYNPNENISAGDIVGVNAGKISKYTLNSRQFMVISTNPTILGNMPAQGQENLYEKVAFMGQIPVKVRGIVRPGDYILPSGLNDGTGIGVAPKNMTAEQYRKIVGVAWSSSLLANGISKVKMSIGLNSNDVADIVVEQEKRILALENKFNSLEGRLLALEKDSIIAPNAIEPQALTDKKIAGPKNGQSRYEMLASNMPSELSDDIMKDAMLYLENAFEKKGISIKDHPGLNKLFTDAAYREEIIRKAQKTYKESYKSILERARN